MTKNIYLFLLLVLAASTGLAQTVTVLDPNGGETLGGCSTYNVLWNAQNTSGYYSIDYSTDNAANWVSVASGLFLPGNGTKNFSWNVPNVNSSTCRIRVVDTYASTVRDSSDAVFTITEALKLTVPDGGEVWEALTNQMVTWNNNSSSTNWRLEYSTNNGSNWTTLNSSYNNSSGNYNWNVNHTPSTQCKFRVTANNNTCITDQSDNVFTITEVPPLITSPNGGEAWYATESKYITWDEQTVLSANVRLEYSTDGGASWILVYGLTPNTGGTFSWQVPNTPTTNGLVRLIESTNTTRKDTSDLPFTILHPIEVNQPNGGDTLYGCSTVVISGNKAKNISRIRLEYTTNNGSSWNYFAAPYVSTNSNSWSDNWNVPNTINSNQCRIRASDYNDATVFDESDANFSILRSNHLTVVSPNGGEVLQSLGNYTIYWNSDASVTYPMVIRYSTNNGSNWTTITTTANPAAGFYNWTNIPNVSSSQCLIQMYPSSNSCIRDTSDATFTINPVKPLLLQPNGGQSWYATDDYNITWDPATIISPDVRLEYSTNGGTAWNLIFGAATSSNGSFVWTVPNTPSTSALVRLIENSGPTRQDTSDAVFEILYPLNLTQPNGGDTIPSCTNQLISGTKARSISRILLEYSTNNGSSWTTIASPIVSTNTTSWGYNWNSGNLINSSQCLIRVSDYYAPSIQDQSDSVFAIQKSNDLILNSPNGGEVLQSQGSYNITWTTTAFVSNQLGIQYSTNNGSNWNAITSSANTAAGQYTWNNIPNVSSNQCLIMIYGSSNACIRDTSDAVFTINPVDAVLTSPNGGESWYGNGDYDITWDASTIISPTVRLEYSTDGGAAWNLIFGSTPSSTGSYYWTVPNTPTSTALVRLIENTNTTRKDTSDAVFNILYPIEVTQPNGGDTIYGCDSYLITGKKERDISRISLEYTTNNGASWIAIASPTVSTNSNSWSYNWTLGNIPASNQCRVRASDYYDATIVDESDANFTILPTIHLSVLAPNGGEILQGQGSYQITWNADVAVSNRLVIRYSTNNGSNWSTITTNANTAAGFYNWTNIPNVSSNQCLVEIYDYYNSCIRDMSDATFTIDPIKPILTSPNGGEGWYATDNYAISWNSLSVISPNVRLEYSTNTGTTWTLIYASTPSSNGSFSWTVPNTPSANALVRMIETTNASRADTSDAVFNILYPIRVEQPNGGDTLYGCDPMTISGKKARNISRLLLEYTTNNGSSWTTISAPTVSTSTNNWASNWTPPNGINSSQCRIRASDYYNQTTSDESDANFTILPSNHLTVVSPNGGELLTALTSYTIYWNADAFVSNVVGIRYSTNNGSNWSTIVTQTSTASGFYNWTSIPNIVSNQCLVEIYDYSNSCIRDQSDQVFSIQGVKPVLTSPDGGEVWFGTDQYNITWDPSTTLSSNVRLEYSIDSGLVWNLITGSTAANSGSFYWTVPNTPSTNALVRLIETNDVTRSDTSDAVFEIKYPIEVLQPNGGDTIYGCSSLQLNGQKARNISRILIEYTLNNGGSWTTMSSPSVSTSSNNWYASWAVPNTISTNQFRIRVSDYYNNAILDEADANSTILPSKHLTVTSPNGGEILQSLGSYNISWNADAFVSNRLIIRYSKNNGASWNTVTTNATTSAGFYSWTNIPNTSSNQCVIEVYDYYNSCIRDTSDSVFTILPVDPILTSPNGGEVWYETQNRSITWDPARLLAGTVRLEYSTNNGSSWQTITVSTNSSSGSYSWSVPGTPSDSCLVRLMENGYPGRVDVSDAVFEIKPAIQVVSPNGNTANEDFRGCTVTTITWNHSPDITRFKVEYTTNGGSSWTQLVTNYYQSGTTGSYNWTIPNSPTSQAMVRVSNYYTSGTFDTSDNFFNITQPVVVVQPAYGGTLQIGATHNITWVSDGISTFYNIDYSTNGGANWINIATNYNTSTYIYPWTVPNTPSANCLVRVTDFLDPCKWDKSDAPFTISSQAAALAITTPNGYDTLAGCGSQVINWTETGTSGFFNIDYSTNAGVTWTPIIANYQSASNSYTWNYPNVSSDYYLVRVTDANDVNKVDQSDAAFAIRAQSVDAGSDTSVCSGNSVNLFASGGVNYQWTPAAGLNNPNVQNPVASPLSTTTYTVSSVVGTCTLTDQVTVTVAPRPTVTANGNTTICSGDSVVLTSSSPTGNLWSNGSTASSITVSVAGDYSVTVNNGGCNVPSDTVTIQVNQSVTPTIAVGGPTTFCQGDSVILTSSIGGGILWSSGDTTQSISVVSSGSYTVTDSAVCNTTSAPVNVTVNPSPTAPVITAGSSTTFCEGDSVVLTSNQGSNIVWNTGDTTASIVADSSATYEVIFTGGNGCTATSNAISVTVAPVSTPTITAVGATSFCQGDSVLLNSSLASGNLWSNGDTTNSIVVLASGNYTVFDQNGCGGLSAAVPVTVSPGPSTPAVTLSGPTTFCSGDSIVLTSSQSSGNSWSNGATTQSISVQASGNFTVTVSDSAGCTASSAPTNVTVNPTPAAPQITTNGPTSFCSGGDVQLSSSYASGNLWTGGSTASAITVNTSGTYHVTYTDSNGCEANSAPMVVTVHPAPPAPLVTSSGPTTVCQGSSVTLSVNANSGILWSNAATTPSIVVNASGSYSVTVTDSNGCESTSAPTNITVTPGPSPMVSASGPTTFCDGGTVTLSTNVGSSFLWSNGAVTPSILVDSSGSFSVTVTDTNGCSGTSTMTNVVEIPTPAQPVVTANGPTTFCSGGSVALTSSYASGNTWIPTNQGTPSITVTTPGNYSVIYTDGNGCTSTSAPIAVNVSSGPATPMVTATGPTTFCSGDSVVLTSSQASGNVWSNGATTQAITVQASGNFSVTVSDSAGCTASSAPTAVTVNASPAIPQISASGPTVFCAGGSVQLNSSYATGNYWTGGSTSNSISVTSSGTYTVVHTNANGCEASSAPISVTVNPLPATPLVSASGPTTFCQGDSVTLNSNVGSGILWSNSATTQSIVATASGSYSVAVTDSNGCTSTSQPTTVTVNPTPVPVVNASGPTTFCEGGTVTLSASTGSSFLWSNGAVTPSILVDSSGTFSVTITDGNGCTGTSSLTSVVELPAPAAPVVSASGPTTFCNGGSVSLTSSYASGNTWIPGNQTTPSITVTASGNYSVIHTNANGCSSTSAAVSVNASGGPATPIVTAAGPTTFCDGDSVTLTSSAGSGILWSSGDVTQSIVVHNSGNYTVTVSDTNGCSAVSNMVAVTVNTTPPVPNITVGGSTTFCDGDFVTLTSSSPVDNVWSPTAQVSQSIQAGTSGTYFTTVTNAFGCSSVSGTVNVTVLPLPATPTITQVGNDLQSSTGPAYQWFLNGTAIPGATSQTYSPTQSGNYTVSITDGNGCEASSLPYPYVFVNVSQAEAGDWLRVFPNPNHGKFFVEIEFAEITDWELRVVDVVGQIVFMDSREQYSGLYKEAIDLSGFASGVYLLQLRSEKGNLVQRVVVQ